MPDVKPDKSQLEILLGQLSAAEPEDRAGALKAFLRESDRDLSDLRTAADVAFATLQTLADESQAEEDFIQLGVLTEIIEAVAARFATIDRIAKLNSRRTEAGQVPAVGSAPAALAVETDTHPADSGDDSEVKTGTIVAASVAKQQSGRASLASIPSSALPAMARPSNVAGFELTTAVELDGVPSGTVLDDIDGLADAAIRRMTAQRRLGAGKYSPAALATLKRIVPEERRVPVDQVATSAIEYASRESNLPGGSLVAAGAWCSESELLPGFCERETMDGIPDFATITTTGGGVKWYRDTGYQALLTLAAGWCFTEEDMTKAAGPPDDPDHRPVKPCVAIPCPALAECRLDACGLCVKIDILMQAGFESWVSNFLRRLIAAHQRQMGMKILGKILARPALEKVTVTAPAGAADPYPYGPAATPTFLNLLELQILHIRGKYRLGMNDSLEVLMPYWIKGVIRADLAKRQGGCDCLAITDAQITNWLAIRGVRAQYIYDWQSGSPTSVIGGTTAPKVWPATVDLLIYRAGNVVVVRQDVLTLDQVYDATSLSRNQFTYFTEEAVCVVIRCEEPTLLTIPLCPNGATTGGIVPEQKILCATG